MLCCIKQNRAVPSALLFQPGSPVFSTLPSLPGHSFLLLPHSPSFQAGFHLFHLLDCEFLIHTAVPEELVELCKWLLSGKALWNLLKQTVVCIRRTKSAEWRSLYCFLEKPCNGSQQQFVIIKQTEKGKCQRLVYTLLFDVSQQWRLSHLLASVHLFTHIPSSSILLFYLQTWLYFYLTYAIPVVRQEHSVTLTFRLWHIDILHLEGFSAVFWVVAQSFIVYLSTM